MPTHLKQTEPARIEDVAPGAREPSLQSDRDSLKIYLNEIGKTPLLKIEEELKLAARIRKGDESARQHMISANLRLVVRIALDYKDFGLPLQDLISEGNIGLIKAVDRYDPSKGGKLSTYASWWIKQSIQRALANQSKTIRLPVHAVAKISQIRKTARALTEKLGHEVTDEELAAELRMPLEKLIHLRSVAVHPASLDAPLGESADASLLGDIVRDEGASSPSEALGSKNVSSDLARAVNSLGEREAMIIRMRFGLDGNDEMTLEEIGKKFNVTRERIRQLEQLSIKHMRRLMENRDNQRSSEEIVEDSIEKGRMEVVKQFVQSRNLLAITDSKSDKIMGRS
ncbi:MAG: sigma-70 family RNA polymerase sigma factor [Verrucomicrobiota bacterium]|jgi:RNA polymerase primary sigma factor|nr:MAG: sigma-70 family RNA polymerase sigma factor [Verrucomicrobiota bacterium]